ncbi:hypothetical protein GCM10023238_00480 [Streptomyces heliomycini]
MLALPRGGAAVAVEVARALDAPLDVLVVRKIGAPFHEEFGVGAMAGDGVPLLDEDALARLVWTRPTWRPSSSASAPSCAAANSATVRAVPLPNCADGP